MPTKSISSAFTGAFQSIDFRCLDNHIYIEVEGNGRRNRGGTSAQKKEEKRPELCTSTASDAVGVSTDQKGTTRLNS